MTTFGERLKKLRHDRGITQEQLAHALNIPESTIRRLETQDGIPRKERITEIASFFGESTDFLLGISKITNDQAKSAIENPKYARLPQEKKKLIDDMIDALSEE